MKGILVNKILKKMGYQIKPTHEGWMIGKITDTISVGNSELSTMDGYATYSVESGAIRCNYDFAASHKSRTFHSESDLIQFILEKYPLD